MTWARVGIGRYKVLWKSNIAIVTKIVERRISETPGNQVLGEGEIHLATFPHWEREQEKCPDFTEDVSGERRELIL